MNTGRMDEIQVEQRAINKVLAAWTITMNEDHYYSLKSTVLDMLNYVMDNTDVKPEVNPLVEIYTSTQVSQEEKNLLNKE